MEPIRVGLAEMLRWVGDAAAVGRVPVGLWCMARQRVYASTESMGLQSNMELACCSTYVPPVTRTHMPLRDEPLRDEPLRALRHFLWVMNGRDIPTDLKLYIFSFVYAREARKRARAAILGVCSHLGCYDDFTQLPRLRIHDGPIVECSRIMLDDSLFLSATASMCDLSAPICITNNYASKLWADLLIAFYNDCSNGAPYFETTRCYALLDLAHQLGLKKAFYALEACMFRLGGPGRIRGLVGHF